MRLLAHGRTAVHRRLFAAELAPSKNEIRHRKPDLKLPQVIRSRALRAERYKAERLKSMSPVAKFSR